MATIMPFQGYRFNTGLVKNLGAAMAPPYDMITDEDKDFLYKQHDYNMARIIRGKSFDGDTDTQNCYTRAGVFLQDWIQNKILIQDPKPSFYLYEMRVEYKNTEFTNQGLIALMGLEPLGEDSRIMTCEDTKPSSKEDRYRLLSAINANADPISCMYIDHEKPLSNFLNEVSEQKPDMEFGTRESITGAATYQRVWVIDDPEAVAFIQQSLSTKQLFITDGHNRYETALEYKKFCAANNPSHTGRESYNYIMTLLTNAYGDGLVQLPVHRYLKKNKKFLESYFIAGAQDRFKVEKIIVDTHVDELVDIMKKQISTPRLDQNRIAVYCGGNYFYRLILKDKEYLKSILPDKSDAYRSLDVTVLNTLILNELLNITHENYRENVGFTKRASKGIAQVQAGESPCLFLINPVKHEQICAVAMAGELMPERTVFLFPKAATGVVVYKFADEVKKT